MKQVARWLDKLTEEAETCKEANEQIAIAFIRSKMIPEFKTFMDLMEAIQFQTDRKRGITCYHCGKAGHVSRDCRTRLTTDKQPKPSPSQGATQTQQTTTVTRGKRKPIVCFNCQQVGHKSPN